MAVQAALIHPGVPRYSIMYVTRTTLQSASDAEARKITVPGYANSPPVLRADQSDRRRSVDKPRRVHEPVGHQDVHIGLIDFAVVVDVAGHLDLTDRLAEVGLAGLARAAIGAHIDDSPIGERLRSERADRIAPIDAQTRDVIAYPGFAGPVPVARLRFQVVVSSDPDVVIRIFRRAVGIPVAGIDEAWVYVDVALAPASRPRHRCR
jgi:hypothetical protein